MAKYRIVEKCPATATWVHIVEAENEDEAMKKMMTGEGTVTAYDVDVDEDTGTIDISPVED